MARAGEIAGRELHHIYAVFRKLRCIRGTIGGGSSPARNSIEFPKLFLLKLIDEKLENLDVLAREQADQFFKQLTRRNKTARLALDEGARNPMLNANLASLDEFFHNALYHLYDFVINLEWHTADTEELSGDEQQYVRSRLRQVSSFLEFRATIKRMAQAKLADFRSTKRVPIGSPAESAGRSTSTTTESSPASQSEPIVSWSTTPSLSASKSVAAIRTKSLIQSSNSQSRVDSPSRKRRVRFGSDAKTKTRTKMSMSSCQANGERDEIAERKLSQDLIDSQSTLALELLLYSFSMLIQRVCQHLGDWFDGHPDQAHMSALRGLRLSSERVRRRQLVALSRDMKISNDIHLSVLDYLCEIERVYLGNRVIGIMCARDSEHLMRMYKIPRVALFIERIGLDIERDLLVRLAEQGLQVLLELIVNDINLPPVELGADTRTGSREQLERRRSNQRELISSWLNIDDIVFGFLAPGAKRARASTEAPSAQPTSQEVSSLQFKSSSSSSSRLLSQTENLELFMRDCVGQVASRLRSEQQLRFYLALMLAGLELAFDTIARQLAGQLDWARARAPPKGGQPTRGAAADELQDIRASIDTIAVKVRCLKLLHVVSAGERLLAELARAHGLGPASELTAPGQLEGKLAKFSNLCSLKTGSLYWASGEPAATAGQRAKKAAP